MKFKSKFKRFVSAALLGGLVTGLSVPSLVVAEEPTSQTVEIETETVTDADSVEVNTESTFETTEGDAGLNLSVENISGSKEWNEIKEEASDVDKEYNATIYQMQIDLFMVSDKCQYNTIDDVFKNVLTDKNDDWDLFLGQFNQTVSLFEKENDSEFYYAFIPVSDYNGKVDIREFVVTMNDETGTVMSECEIDENTNAIKIPKKYYEMKLVNAQGEEKEGLAPLKSQVMVAKTETQKTKVPVIVKDKDDNIIVEKELECNSYDVEMYLDLKEFGIDSNSFSDFDVFLNEAEDKTNEISDLQLKDGVLAIKQSPQGVKYVTIKYEPTIEEKIDLSGSKIYEAETESVKVKATVPKGAFDKDVKLSVSDVDNSLAEKANEEISQINNWDLGYTKWFDVRFLDAVSGKEIEPNKELKIEVEIKNSDEVKFDSKSAVGYLVHSIDDNNSESAVYEALEICSDEESLKNTKGITKSFSLYGAVVNRTGSNIGSVGIIKNVNSKFINKFNSIENSGWQKITSTTEGLSVPVAYWNDINGSNFLTENRFKAVTRLYGTNSQRYPVSYQYNKVNMSLAWALYKSGELDTYASQNASMNRYTTLNNSDYNSILCLSADANSFESNANADPNAAGNYRVIANFSFNALHAITLIAQQKGIDVHFADNASKVDNNHIYLINYTHNSTGYGKNAQFSADVQNIINKARSGGTLTPSEADLYFGTQDLVGFCSHTKNGMPKASDKAALNLPEAVYRDVGADGAVFYNEPLAVKIYHVESNPGPSVNNGIPYMVVGFVGGDLGEASGGQEMAALYKFDLDEDKTDLKLKKSSSKNNSDHYSKAGAEYTVAANSDGSGVVGKLTTNANGDTNTLTQLENKVYYVKETKPSPGHDVDAQFANWKKVDLTGYTEDVYTIQSTEPPKTCELHIVKTSTKAPNGYDCKSNIYTFAGAKFTIVGKDGNTTVYNETKTTDANGKIDLTGLPLATYTVTETDAPYGYTLNTQSQSHDFPASSTGDGLKYTMTFENAPLFGDPNFKIQKRDKYLKKYLGQGDITLGDAYYALTRYDNLTGSTSSSTEDRTMIFKTDSKGVILFTLVGNAVYFDSDLSDPWWDGFKKGEYPLGTYTIKEIIPPVGQNLDKNTYKFIFKEDDANNNGVLEWIDKPNMASNDTVLISDQPPTLTRIKIVKHDADRWEDDKQPSSRNQAEANLAGTKFEIRNMSEDVIKYPCDNENAPEIAKGALIDTLTISRQSDGKYWVETKNLPVGTYEIKEIKDGAGYEPIVVAVDKNGKVTLAQSEKVSTVENKKSEVYIQDNQLVVNIADPIDRTDLKLVKQDFDFQNASQGDANRKSAKYTIKNMCKDADTGANQQVKYQQVKYKDKWYEYGAVIDTVTIDAGDETGVTYTTIEDLPYGTYELQEVSAPTTPEAGYNINNKKVTVTLHPKDGTSASDTSDCPLTYDQAKDLFTVEMPDEKIKFGDFYTVKVDDETMKSASKGGTNLGAAQYSIYNISKYKVKWNGKVYAPETAESASHPMATKTATWNEERKRYEVLWDNLPYGTYLVKETKSGEGYYINSKTITHVHHPKTDDENTGRDLHSQEAYRDEFQLVKVHERTMGRLSVPFVITMYRTAEDRNAERNPMEAHVIVTDVNGNFDSEQFPHSQNTNGNDHLLNKTNIKTSDYKANCGVWFSKDEFGNVVDPKDWNLRGALPYGYYTMKELRCEANEGLELVRDIKFDVYAPRDPSGKTHKINFGTIDDLDPTLQTVALDKATKTHVLTKGTNVTFTDTIMYNDVMPTHKNTIKETLYDYATGQALATASKEIPMGMSHGQLKIDFTGVDTTKLAGKKLYIGAELFDEDGKKLYEHKDKDDEDQQLFVPGVTTNAIDVNTNFSISKAGETVWKDSVKCTNLVIGQVYTVTTTFMETASKPAFTSKDGKVSGSKSFVATATTMNVPVEVYLNNDDLLAKDYVAFTELTVEDVVVGDHKDMSAAEQTITVSKITTTATDKNTNNHQSVSGQTTWRDSVHCTNLKVGTEYTIITKFMKDEKTAVTDTVTKKFTATDKNMDIPVEVNVNTDNLDEGAYTAFTELKYGNVVVAEHKDINAVEQTIYVAGVKTTATDIHTEKGITRADATVWRDKVECTNLIIGQEYTVTTTFMKDLELSVVSSKGNAIASKKFKATDTTMVIDLDVEVDARDVELGRDYVAFAELKIGNNLVGKHKDLTAESQTIAVLKVETTATDVYTGTHQSKAGETVWKDTVKMTNLKVGETYKLVTTFMEDKYTPAFTSKGGKVAGEKIFVADKKDMNIEVEVFLNSDTLEAKDYVAFTDLYLEDDVVAYHRDMGAVSQTMSVTRIGTEATDNVTKDHTTTPGYTTVVDRVTWTNMKVGEKVRFRSILMDQETGKSYEDSDGVKYIKEIEVIPNKKDGYIDIVFENVKATNGKRITVFETAYSENQIAIAHHEEIGDVGQTVYVPDVKTTVIDTTTKNHTAFVGVDGKFRDSVKYKNLDPDKNYVAVGKIMEEVDGKAVYGGYTAKSEPFSPESRDEAVIDVDFTDVDTKALAGKKIVVYEYIYEVTEFKADGYTLGERVIVSHEDIKDEGQTIYIPKVETEAIDTNTTTHTAVNGKTTIKDTVSYENLEPHTKYRFVERLCVDGKPVEGVGEQFIEVTPVDRKKNTLDIEFKDVDLSVVAGKKVTVYTYAYMYEPDAREPMSVATVSHEEPNNDKQSLWVPVIHTTASTDINDKTLAIGDKVIVHDAVAHNNLPNGKYTYKTWVVDQETEEKVSEIITTDFENKHMDAVTYIDIELNTTDVRNKTYVVYEELLAENGYLITSHKDIVSKEQSVYVPDMYTTATTDINEKTMAVGESVVLHDKVTYINLYDGSYTLETTVMKKSDATQVGETVVTDVDAANLNGEWNVDITLDTRGLKGEDLVIFEVLKSRDGKEVIRHENIDDKGQTVYVPDIGTLATTDINVKTMAVGEEVTLTDTVSYTNLYGGKYVLKTTPMDKETGEAVGETVSTEVENTEMNGEWKVDVKVNTTNLVGRDVVIFEELESVDGKPVIDHKNLEDEGQTVYVPNMGTTALTDVNEKVLYIGEKALINDTVKYENLYKGEYVLETWAVKKSSGEAVSEVVKTDVKVETEITADGEWTVVVPVNTTEIRNEDIVIFEVLKSKDGKTVIEHKDIGDKEQTVYVPDMKTTATTDINEKVVAIGEDITVHDKVSYQNLVDGVYSLETTVMRKSNGEAVSDTVVTEVKAENGNGEWNVDIKLNTTDIRDDDFVVFEVLKFNGRTVIEHKDIEDKDQTVYVPDMGTTAGTEITGKVMPIGMEPVVKDTVKYKNLVPGKYVLETWVVKKSNGEAVSEVVTTNVENDKIDGTWNVEIKVNTSEIRNENLVVFEVLKDLEGKTVIEHKDLEDEDQTVYVPDMGTKATTDIGKLVAVGDVVTVHDTVSYTNLPEGTFKLETYLVRKSDGKQVSETVVSEVKTEGGKRDGEWNVDIRVNSNEVKGETLVVFETLKSTDGHITILEHKDINDEEQTVYVPTMGTKAFGDCGKLIDIGENVVIHDNVSYTNMVEGVYTLETVAVKKSDGKVVSDTITTSVTAVNGNGMWQVDVPVNTCDLASEEIVIFETLKSQDGKTTILEHKDINDTEQTVKVVEPGTRTVTSTAKTGDNKTAIIAGIGLAAAGATLTGVIVRRRRKSA